MHPKLPTLLLASIFLVCLSSSALAATPPSLGSGTAPTAPSVGLVIDSPSNGSYLNSLNITISWHMTGSEAIIQYYLVKVDEGAWINNSLHTSISLIMPQEGAHLARVQAWTEIGGVYADDVLFVVDKVPPTIIGHAPTGSEAPASSLIVISFSEEMEVSSVVVTGIQGGSSWSGSSLTLTPNDPLQLDHEYVVTVLGQDLAGNDLSEYTWSFSTTSEGSVAGQVRDGRNSTVPGADVLLISRGEVIASTTTDSDGRFQLSAPSGTYNLTISKSDVVTKTVQVEIVSGEEMDLGVVEVELAPDYAWVLINAVIVVGAVGLFWVGRRNQRLGRK